MASPTSFTPVDAPVAAKLTGRDPQREFLRLALGHAHWFARWFGAQGKQAADWLDSGLSTYPLALGEAMPARRPQLFWRAMLGAELPGSGRLVVDDDHPLVEVLLSQLDPAARAAFLLRVWHDFDDELLADLLGLRVGQVRVGLMRATGLMRARLQVGGDGIADARQWLQLFRARLATLTAPLEMGARTQIRQRLDRLFDTQEPEVASAAEAVSTLETAAALRETSLTDAAIIIDAEQSAPRSADFSGNEFDRVGLRASPVAATSPGRVRFWRYATALRWGLPLVCVLLAILGFWWFGKPASPLGVPAATPDATTPPATMQRSTAPIPESDVQAVLASPDLPLLDGQLMPSQLAVMDQLRWWASTQPDSGDAGLSSRPVDVTPEPLDDAPATFAQLAAADRRLLQGFASLWPRLGTEQRLTLLDNARRWRGLDASGRERVVRRSQSFSALPAQARARARDSFILWQSLPPAERDGLVAAFAAFAALPPDQQRTVADGFSRLSPSEQAPWRFVEGERELLALAGRVFSFVPEVERGATLALLQSLDEADRDRLRQGTRRMSAWQREQLRKALLAEPVASRSDWLRRRLGG